MIVRTTRGSPTDSKLADRRSPSPWCGFLVRPDDLVKGTYGGSSGCSWSAVSSTRGGGAAVAHLRLWGCVTADPFSNVWMAGADPIEV